MSSYRKILLESNQYVEMLLLKCDKNETGVSIMKKAEILNERRELYRTLVEKQEQLRQNIRNIRQKFEDNSKLLKRLYEKIQNVNILLQQGE